MLDYQVIKSTITTEKHLFNMIDLYNTQQPTVGAFDTESTGLHIISDVPFLFQFGWIKPNTKKIYTFVIDLERQPKLGNRVLNIWNNLAKQLEFYSAHNTTYDMHMLTNINHPYVEPNLIDTTICIRLAHDNIPVRFGGVNLKLKNYATKYIDKSARSHDKLLQTERSRIAKDLNKKLQNRFKATSKETILEDHNSWTVKAIQEITKDILFDPEELPHKELTKAYHDWLEIDVPNQIGQIVVGRVDRGDVPYNLLNRENVVNYGHYDIVWTLAIFMKTYPVVINRENEYALDLERKLIPVIYSMERQGFAADAKYIAQAKKKLKAYIIKRRTDLLRLTGREFTVAQHKVIKSILNNKFELGVESTGADVLDAELSNLDPEDDVHKMITYVQELRTLEKWYSTYLLKLEHDLIKSDRLYTQINSVGTVSGRVSSNFQQFPKGAITDLDGNELFNPRRIIIMKNHFLLDYSQIELRIQAAYTILLEDPDMNLCRAYMPFKCYRENNFGDKEEYNPKDLGHKKSLDQDWYHNEDDELWHPIDLHGATTKAAFDIDENHEDFKKLRSIGKRINFAKNYGAGFKVTRKVVTPIIPDITEEELHVIDNAYYKAFPGIKTYQDYCYRLANSSEYATNFFGARYWNVTGHKLINMLIQGAGAYLLKEKELAIYNYLFNKYSNMVFNIHDEIIFDYDPRDPISIFKDIVEIMEEWDDLPVPIRVDIERTQTYWNEKEDYKI
jgi:DNA polymerase-1